MMVSIAGAYKDIAAASAAVAAAAFALSGSIYAAAVAISVSTALYIHARKKSGEDHRMQLYGMLKMLSKSYKRRRSMLPSLEESLSGSSTIEKRFLETLLRYKSGDADAFLRLRDRSDAYISELASLIWRALHFGDDVYLEMCELKYSIGSEINKRLKMIGQVGNARFVSLMGILIFFPLFAGISVAILSSAPQLGSSSSVSITSITFVFAAYLAIESFVHFKDDNSMDAARKASSMAVCGSFGLLLLKAGSVFALNMI